MSTISGHLGYRVHKDFGPVLIVKITDHAIECHLLELAYYFWEYTPAENFLSPMYKTLPILYRYHPEYAI